MDRPTTSSITAGLLGGVANAALAVSLVATAGYPVVLRSRFRGWTGGRFTDESDAG